MAVLAAILPVVSRSSCLALELYQFAASSPGEAKDLIKVAKVINNFASILKQVGTIIKEDDRLPSYEVRHSPCSRSVTLHSAVHQHQAEWQDKTVKVVSKMVHCFMTIVALGLGGLVSTNLFGARDVYGAKADLRCRLSMY